MEIHDAVKALAAAAQMNVIEFHTWNATVAKNLIDRPDRIDLRPRPRRGRRLDRRCRKAALLVAQLLLQQLGLASWLKTSGGKGLHVVVPIWRRRWRYRAW